MSLHKHVNISRRIARRHSGNVWVENRHGSNGGEILLVYQFRQQLDLGVDFENLHPAVGPVHGSDDKSVLSLGMPHSSEVGDPPAGVVIVRQLVHHSGFLQIGTVIDPDFVIRARRQDGIARDG